MAKIEMKSAEKQKLWKNLAFRASQNCTAWLEIGKDLKQEANHSIELLHRNFLHVMQLVVLVKRNNLKNLEKYKQKQFF